MKEAKWKESWKKDFVPALKTKYGSLEDFEKRLSKVLSAYAEAFKVMKDSENFEMPLDQLVAFYRAERWLKKSNHVADCYAMIQRISRRSL